MATIKQKKAVKKIVDNRGNISKGMKEAGYSENTAKNPKNLTESKGWQDLMKKYLPDEDLAKKHKELLNKKEGLVRYNSKKKKWEIVKTKEIDAQAVGKGLDMGYKLKGKYTPTKIKLIDENEELKDEQLDKEEQQLDERIATLRKKAKHPKKQEVKKKARSA